MKSLLPNKPIELLIDNPGTGLKTLREVRDKYIKTGNMSAASRVSELIGDTFVDQDD